MSLRPKIVLIVSLVVTLYAVIDHLLQRAMVSPSFDELERVEAGKDIERVVKALETEIGHLDQRCLDRSAWNDTYHFVQEFDGVHEHGDEAVDCFICSNLNKRSFVDDNINLLYVCDTDGRVVWGKVLDWRADRELTLRSLPRDQLAPNHAYLVTEDAPRALESPRGFISGLVMTEHGPMLLSSRPILTSEGEGPVRGTVILGRFLDEALIESLNARTNVDFTLWTMDDPDMPGEARQLLSRVTSARGAVIDEFDGASLHLYTTFPDMRKAPSLLLRAHVPRDITAKGATSVRYAFLSTIAAGMLLLLVLLVVLQHMVLTPIGKLTDHAVQVGRTEDPSSKLVFEDRGDEIGVLSREFDSMMEKLTLSRAALVETARSAGMSEIATGILHNIGNVLNSMNVSANMVAQRVKDSKLVKLTRLSQMVESKGDALGDFIQNDPKGQRVAPYLSEVTRLMTVEQDEVASEVDSLNEGIEHIRQLVNSQQAYAGAAGPMEPTDVLQQVERAREIAAQAVGIQLEVEVERAFDELPKVRLDRHKLMEVLVNVCKNAYEAMENDVPLRRLTLAVRAAGDERLRIEVSDTGPGIPEENLAKIFSHGFTTKEQGHGFGLHTSANAAKEMNGSLVARANEHGGATFVLELPMGGGPEN